MALTPAQHDELTTLHAAEQVGALTAEQRSRMSRLEHWSDNPRPVTQWDLDTVLDLTRGPRTDGALTYGTTPDEIATDNARRAQWAAAALTTYANITSPPDEAIRTVIADLLGDLRHLADCVGLDFSEMSDRSLRDYYDETAGRL